MCRDEEYVVQSLELHLFFARIMREHALFLQAGFTPADPACARRAGMFRREFEDLLCRAAILADGLVSPNLLASGEVVTEFTQRAERQTSAFTGIPINGSITARESRLKGSERPCVRPEAFRQVDALNARAARLLDGLIALKEEVLERVLHCGMFTGNYPLLLEHIIREGKLYREFVCQLRHGGALAPQAMCDVERFWNQIMMEHAQFIRGLLDPAESALVDAADGFAKDYAKLLSESCRAQDRVMGNSAQETRKFRDFKAAGAKGIADCKIRSIILPLLADHVLREANHYLRLLEA